ncbi:MAG: peptidoglycan-binding protein [Pseudomonadota bacterium]
MILFARDPDLANVSGHLIETMQTALAAQGCPPGGVDGIFGRETEVALRAWQVMSAQPETGVLTFAGWELLTGLPAPTLRDLCLQVTAAIEGHGFQKVIGNFDGEGLTWGYMGFTLTDGMEDLLASIDADIIAGPKARSIFGVEKWAALMAASKGSKRTRLAFADRLSVGTRRIRVRSDWERAFARLGAEPSVKRLQLAASQRHWNSCIDAVERYKPKDVLSVGMFYDACTQHGSISHKRQTFMDEVGQNTDAQQRRHGWVEALAKAASPRWRDRVRARRSLFADGAGKVLGAQYNLKHWGFSGQLAELDYLRDLEFTPMPEDYRREASAAPDIIAAIDWLEDVPVPSRLNVGLRQASNTYVVSHLGMPRGDFSDRCRRPAHLQFREKCDFDFRYPQLGRTGWALRLAKESFAEVLDEVGRRQPALYALLGQSGMGCCRWVRGSTAVISNHSFGIAIDLTIGGRTETSETGKIMRGMLEIIGIAREFKWYSGASFGPENMTHLEVSRNLMDEWLATGHLKSVGGATETARMIQQGSRGDEVRDVQRLLNRFGGGLRVDGLFGAATNSALKWFQSTSGLVPSGITDTETIFALQVAAAETS